MIRRSKHEEEEMKSTIDSDVRPVVASRTGTGRLTLTHPVRAYAMTRNPFAIAAVLPLIVMAVLGVEVALLFEADPYAICGGLLVATAGLLLIPAINLRGSLTLTHDGVSFERGKQGFTAPWEHIAGLVYRRESGVCLEVVHPEIYSTKKNGVKGIRMPGGLRAEPGKSAIVPLRLFGDRQFSILYDVRERLPQDRCREALDRASIRGSGRILAVYALTTAICCAALFASMYAITH